TRVAPAVDADDSELRARVYKPDLQAVVGGVQGGRVPAGPAADDQQLRFARVGHGLYSGRTPTVREGVRRPPPPSRSGFATSTNSRLTPAARPGEWYARGSGPVVGQVTRERLAQHDESGEWVEHTDDDA